VLISNLVTPPITTSCLAIRDTVASSSALFSFKDRYILREDKVHDDLASFQVAVFRLYDRDTGLIHSANREITKRWVSHIHELQLGGWSFVGRTREFIGSQQSIFRGYDVLITEYSTSIPTPFGRSTSKEFRINGKLPELDKYNLSDEDKRFLPFYHPEWAPYEFEMHHYVDYEIMKYVISDVTIEEAKVDFLIMMIARILGLEQTEYASEKEI
jgi:hypothetical protein